MVLHDGAVQLVLDRILDNMLHAHVAPSDADFLPTDDTFPCLSNPGMCIARARQIDTLDGDAIFLHSPFFARDLRDVFAEKRTSVHVACGSKGSKELSIVAFASMDDGFRGVRRLHERHHSTTLDLFRAELELRHVPPAAAQMVFGTLVPTFSRGLFRDQVPHLSGNSSYVRAVP